MRRATAERIVRRALRVRAAKLDPSDLNKVREMTDRNAHTEARRYVAEEILRDRKQAKAWRAFEALHKHFGGLDAGLSEVQRALEKQLLATAKQKLGVEYGALHDAL